MHYSISFRCTPQWLDITWLTKWPSRQVAHSSDTIHGYETTVDFLPCAVLYILVYIPTLALQNNGAGLLWLPTWRWGNWGLDLDLLKPHGQEFADMWLILRFFTAKTNVSPTETVSFVKCLSLLFINEERQRKGWGHNWKQETEMLISSWLTILGLWFPTSFSVRTNFTFVNKNLVFYYMGEIQMNKKEDNKNIPTSVIITVNILLYNFPELFSYLHLVCTWICIQQNALNLYILFKNPSLVTKQRYKLPTESWLGPRSLTSPEWLSCLPLLGEPYHHLVPQGKPAAQPPPCSCYLGAQQRQPPGLTQPTAQNPWHLSLC